MAEPAVDDWQPVAAAAPPADDWQTVGSPHAMPSMSGGGMPIAAQIFPRVASLMEAFGHGFKESYGPEQLRGLPDETVKMLSDAKIFGPAKGGYDNPLQAAAEILMNNIAGAPLHGVEQAFRGVGGAMRGAAAVSEELGLPRDISGILGGEYIPSGGVPHAAPSTVAAARIFGPQHPFGPIKGMPVVLREVPAESRIAPAAAEGAPKFIEAYHGSPHDFERFDISKIGMGEGAQAYGHGLYFAESKDVAEHYQKDLTAPGNKASETVFAEAALRGEYGPDPIKGLELQAKEALTRGGDEIKNEFVAEKFNAAIDLIKKGFTPHVEGGALYRVRINADPEHFLDWDKPLSEQSAHVRKALEPLLREFGDKNTAVGEYLYRYLGRQEPVGEAGYKILQPADEAKATAILREAGIPGIKYLDQGSRTEGAGTRNYVVFDDNSVEITHKNNMPVGPADIPDRDAVSPAIAEARDLGVIGLPKPDVSKMAPAEAAAAEVPRAQAATRPDEVVRGAVPGEPEKAGNIRLDQIGINADAKDVILEAAKANDDFNQARAGNVLLAQVESLSNASGIPSATLTKNAGLGRLMHNDAVVRTWLQAFHQASDEIAAQLTTVKNTGSEADIAKLREMKLRFQHMQEQVSGLTAEAGRTLAVFKEFYEARGQAEALGKVLEDNPGNDAASLKKLADAAGGLDPRTQLPKFLADANKPTFWDKYLYFWVNALISGPITHTKYIGANAAFAAYEAGVVTPIAGALGTVRRLFNRVEFTPAFRDAADGAIKKAAKGEDRAALATREGITQPSNQYEPGYVDRKGAFHTEEEAAAASQKAAEGVYAGESAARMYGLLAGTPDALKAAWTAAKNNMMTPFPNEVAGKVVNPLTQVRPSAIGGRLGFAIGIPGRSAAGIHSFFRWLGYRAEIEAQAYRGAAKEGLSPLDGDKFWQRRAELAANPTEAMMNAGIENGNHLTFIGEQGTFGRAVSSLANTRMGPGGMQPFKLIMPFTHIPGQILRAGLEQTPAAFLDAKMRGDLLGSNGAVAQDTAMARLVAGGAIGAMVANWAVNDVITGYGPTEQNDRIRWLRTHEPYSVRVGGWWVSYNKFGPIGDLVGLYANLVDVGPKVGEGEYAQAAGHLVNATARMLEDEVGMQGLVNLIEALDDKEGSKMGRFLSSQTASNMPYSSLLRQTASFNDPIMRDAKTFVDQLRYSTPWSRQDLLPKRDWLGEPMTNPGYHSILRQRAVNPDPIDIEASQMRGFRPAPPLPHINNVALPPKLYDEYQAYAGGLTRGALEQMVKQPGWANLPIFVREQAFHATVEQMRKTAGAIMQAKHPEIIDQGLDDKRAKINGEKPTKLKE